METRPYSKLLSWITGWGALDQKKLQEDVDRLTAFYYDNGYLNVQIAPPQVIRNGEKHHDRGNYRRGHAVPSRPHRHRRQSEVSAQRTAQAADDEERATVPRIVVAAAGAGAVGFLLESRLRVRQRRSAHAARPDTNKRVNVIFVINPGHEVLIDRINISGNTKTSDKVIRREIQVQEQEPYSAEEIRDSQGAAATGWDSSATRASPPRRRRSPTRSIWT